MIPPSFDSLIALARKFDVFITSALHRLRESRSWSFGVLDCELDVNAGKVRRQATWITVCKAVRNAQARLQAFLEITHALEASERFLQIQPERIGRCVRLRFKDFNIYFLRSSSEERLRAVALKQR